MPPPIQLPLYRSSQRGASAPRGFSPGSSQPTGAERQSVEPLTQANNGGPRGFGQPKAPLRMSAPSQGPSEPQGAPAPQGPTPLYPPTTPVQTAEQLVWANRYSQNPLELLARAGQQVLGRPLSPFDVQQIVGPAQTVDEAMATFGQWLQQQTGQPSAAASALTPIQSAILGPLS
ncbi:MAG: hypothetical protein EBS05_16870 [Proteobacteria bacterium]|nr:hypothetical protein [Pseudomonadota bacterium]